MNEVAPVVWQEEIDLRGEVCPYTFVKTKLALEDMDSGERILVILDFPESARSVPRSAEREGHQVLANVEAEPGVWHVIVQKK